MRVQPMVHFGSRLLQVSGIPYSAPGMADVLQSTIAGLKDYQGNQVYEIPPDKAESRLREAGFKELAGQASGNRFYVLSGPMDTYWQEYYDKQQGKHGKKVRDADIALLQATTPPSGNSRAVSVTVTGPGEPRWNSTERGQWSGLKNLKLDDESRQTLINLIV